MRRTVRSGLDLRYHYGASTHRLDRIRNAWTAADSRVLRRHVRSGVKKNDQNDQGLSPNSLVLIMDFTSGIVPDKMDSILGYTESCIAVGTLAEMDGETEITLTDNESEWVGQVIFDGPIKSRGREISVCNTRSEVILSIHAPSESPSVKVKVNDGSEPDKIEILVY